MVTPQRQAPLFHPRALRDRLAAHTFPADIAARHARILPLIASLRAGKIDEGNEVRFHGEFLGTVFAGALGYRRVGESGAEGWELEAEKRVGGGGKSADAALGFFKLGGAPRVVAPIELKGSKQSLDHALGRVKTPVEQAWDYANHSPGCRWIIVSNYRETRLYSPARTPDFYASFLLEELEQLERFKEFYFILARENLLPDAPEGTSPTDDLLAASAKVEAEITKELYDEYKKLRKSLYEHLTKVHSNIPALDLLGYTQTILDRILFIAFAEDRGLLPGNTIGEACDHRDKYRPQPIWDNFKAVFRAIDEGSEHLKFPAYNGGLFALRPEVESLEVSDAMCKEFKHLARYDFREEISVDVLGHIFEQSITDLEEMRAAAGAVVTIGDEKVSKRRKEGIFYTPAYITRYIVDQTLGRVLKDRFQAIYDAQQPDERKKAKEKDAAWIAVWESYREAIKGIRVLDLACGSGAFLVAAFDALSREYDRVNAALAALREGQVELGDLTKTVLNNNLFGVDLNQESVEITKLSLWLKTAQRGRKLTYLDSNIKWGNSIVSDADVDRFAFDWRTGAHARAFLDPPTAPEAAEIDARWRAGFDVVIGNPPYIRQELLGAIKPHLEKNYRAYHGVADIYVYFFERGLRELKPGGRLGFIVANKWLKVGYAEPLRKMLAKETRIETLVDFGHAPVFPDADAFPCIVTVAKPGTETPAPEDHRLDVTTFPRELLHMISVPEYVATNNYPVPQNRLGSDGWSLEPHGMDALLEKIRGRGAPLREIARVKPYYGIKTGCNEAFVIDTTTRDRLVAKDPRASNIVRKFVRGQDIARWAPEWKGLWMIFARRGIDIDTYPSVKEYLETFREALEPKPADWKGGQWRGRKPGSYKWYELQDTVDYWEVFAKPKIIWKDLSFHSDFSFDDTGCLTNDLCFILPTSDMWLLAVLNSPLMWAFLSRHVIHGKDEVLRLKIMYMEDLPIAPLPASSVEGVAADVSRLIDLTKQNSSSRIATLDSLRLQFDIETPGQKLEDFATLSPDAFVKEVLSRRPKSAGKLKSGDLKALRELYDEEALPVQERRREALVLEKRLSALVNEAYGLTPEEVELMWSTAPPRMPVGK